MTTPNTHTLIHKHNLTHIYTLVHTLIHCVIVIVEKVKHCVWMLYISDIEDGCILQYVVHIVHL
jgi:hypothetical protein